MPVELEILNNVRCRVSGLPKTHFAQLDELLAMPIVDAFFAGGGQRKRGHWDDGKKHLFYWQNTEATKATFPKGLLSRVEEYLEEEGVQYDLIDHRKNVLSDSDIDLSVVHADMLEGVSMSGMYSFQLPIVKTALKMQSGILWLATNSGKSEVAAAVIKAMPDLNVLFVVPKKVLLKQTVKRLAERLGTIEQEIGVIGGGQFKPKSITVAIINSLKPRKVTSKTSAAVRAKTKSLKAFLKAVDCVFLDEGHRARSNLWYKFVQGLRSAQFRYVLSGTPFGSGNALMVEAATGPVIARVTNKQLIDLGVSAEPWVTMVEIQGSVKGSNWHEVYTDGMVNNQWRNTVIAKKAAAFSREGKSVLILVAQLIHGDTLCRMVRAEGISCVSFVYGDTPDNVIEEEKERFEEHAGSVLIASPIFDEGIDIPDMRGLIIADGGKSPRAVLQKIGRGIRKKKTGANVIEVIDFADLGHKWLSDHSLERIAIFEGEGFDVSYSKPDAEGNVEESRTDEQNRKEKNSKSPPQDVQLSTDNETDEVYLQQTSESIRRAGERAGSFQEVCDRMSWHRRLP